MMGKAPVEEEETEGGTFLLVPCVSALPFTDNVIRSYRELSGRGAEGTGKTTAGDGSTIRPTSW